MNRAGRPKLTKEHFKIKALILLRDNNFSIEQIGQIFKVGRLQVQRYFKIVDSTSIPKVSTHKVNDTKPVSIKSNNNAGVLTPKYELIADKVCEEYRNKVNTGKSNNFIMKSYGIISKATFKRVLKSRGLR